MLNDTHTKKQCCRHVKMCLKEITKSDTTRIRTSNWVLSVQ